ncbi:DUF748 domain-containing protein [Pseudomonadota bacterium]
MPSYPRKTLRALFLLLLLLIPIALALFPYGIEYGIKRWMQEHGEEGTIVDLEDVDFNPLTATLGIYNLKVAVSGEAPLLIPELDLHLSLGPLLRKQVEIGAITIKGVRLLVKRPDAELLHIGGMLLNEATQKPEKVEAQSDRPWGIAIKAVRIMDTEIHYRDAHLDTQLRIDDVKLDRLVSYSPAQTAELAFQGALDGAPITIAGQLLPFATEPSFSGRIDIGGIQLARYAGLLPPDISVLEGSYSMASDLLVRYRKTQILDVKHEGSVALKQIAVESEAANIQNESLSWNGQLQLNLPLAQGPTKLALDGRLETGPLSLSGGEIPTIEQEALHWQGTLGYRAEDGKSDIDLGGVLGLSGLVVQLPEEQGDFQQESLSWNGKLAIGLEADTSDIKLGGTLNATGLAAQLEAIDLDMAAVEAPGLDLAIQQSETGLTVTHNGEILLQGLMLETADISLDKADLQWDGQTALAQSPSGTLQLDSEGALNGGPLELALKPQEMALSYQMVGWQGSLKLAMAEALETLALNGGLRLEQLQLDAPEQQYGLLRFDRMLADGLSITDPEHIEVQKIGISQLSMGQAEQAEALLSAEHFAVSGVAFSKEDGLSISSLEPKGIKGVAHRDKEGQWNFDRLIAALKQDVTSEPSALEAEEAVTDRASEETAMPIHIQKIALSGKNQIQFKDDTPDPPFQADINLERFNLTDLNSTKPTAMSPFELIAQVDEKAHLDFSGGIAPFAPDLGLGLKGQIEGLPLPPLSSYTGKMLGYNLDSGELNMDTTLDINEGQVKGDNTLTIHQLDVSPLSAEKMAELNTELSMPLDTALGMLRDKNNTIKLDLPVAGALDDLQVDPSDAINQAIGRALKKGATTYLTAALFPFGTMLTIAQIAGEQAAKVRLDPIFFEPATVAILEKDQEYLAKIASILEERPEMHIKVCGRAVEADRNALYAQAQQKLAAEAKAEAAKDKATKGKAATIPTPNPISDEQLSALAAQRATVIEQYMVDSHGIKGNRLISCQPQVEKDGQEAKPRTELLL